MDNVLILLPTNSAGGAEKYLNTVASHFLSRNFNVDVFFFKRDEKSMFFSPAPGLKLYYTKRNRELTGLFEFLNNLFKNQEKTYKYAFSSHVHCNSLLSVLKALKLTCIDHLICRESTNVFVRFSGLRLMIFRAVYRGYSRSIDLLICQTVGMKRQLLESRMSIFTRLNLSVLRNPINLRPQFVGDNRFYIKKSKTMDDSNSVRIVLVARVSRVKDVLFALHVLYILKYSKKLDCHLTIVGEIGDTIYYTELLDYININEMNLDVTFTGQLPYTETAILESDVCILTSKVEGFPNVLLEYMKANKFIVSSRCFDSYIEYNKVIFVNSAEEMAQNIFDRRENKLPIKYYDDYLKLHSTDFFFTEVFKALKLS